MQMRFQVRGSSLGMNQVTDLGPSSESLNMATLIANGLLAADIMRSRLQSAKTTYLSQLIVQQAFLKLIVGPRCSNMLVKW